MSHVKTWACIKPDGDGCDGNHILTRKEQILALAKFNEYAYEHLELAHQGAELRNKELKPLIQALAECVSASGEIMWINQCWCDKAYTGRDMHEPSALCGELDELQAKLAKLDELLKKETV